MDDFTRARGSWAPERRIDGSVEISVNFEHENGRFVFDSVTPERYKELYDQGVLKWQRKNLPRPEHNPTPETLALILEAERERRALAQAEAERARREQQEQLRLSRLRRMAHPIKRVKENPEESEVAAEEGGFDENEARNQERADYLAAIDALSRTPQWAEWDVNARTLALAKRLGRVPFVTGSFLRSNPDIKRKLEAAGQVRKARKPSPPASDSPARTRMDRSEKLGILRILVASLKRQGRTVNRGMLAEAATRKGGPLDGKTTEASLKTFLYTLKEKEAESLGL